MRVLRNVVFVGDENNRISLAMQILEQRHDFFAGLRVKVSRGLVCKNNRGGIDERSRDRNTLALAAGEFVRLVTHAARKIDALERFLGLLNALFRRRSVINQRQFDVVQRGGARQKIECLEHESNFLVADVGKLVVVEFADEPAC